MTEQEPVTDDLCPYHLTLERCAECTKRGLCSWWLNRPITAEIRQTISDVLNDAFRAEDDDD